MASDFAYEVRAMTTHVRVQIYRIKNKPRRGIKACLERLDITGAVRALANTGDGDECSPSKAEADPSPGEILWRAFGDTDAAFMVPFAWLRETEEEEDMFR